MESDLELEEFSIKNNSLPPPYEIIEDNGFTPNTNPYKAQQEAAVRLSGFHQKKEPQVKKLDWIISSISFVCCLACGIPSIIFTFSACKDAEEGKTIETNRKVKYGRGFALVAIVTGTVMYTACCSLVAVIVIVVILQVVYQ